MQTRLRLLWIWNCNHYDANEKALMITSKNNGCNSQCNPLLTAMCLGHKEYLSMRVQKNDKTFLSYQFLEKGKILLDIFLTLEPPGGKGDEPNRSSYHSWRRYIPEGHEHHFESSGVYIED
jgi:hypothetical protein